MRVRSSLLCLLLFFSFVSPAQAQRRAPPPPAASVYGRVVEHRHGRVFPVGSLPIYLFTLEQSKPLRDLQQMTYQRIYKENRKGRTDAVIRDYLHLVAGLVPALPRMAETKTDKQGWYRFKSVPAGQRYQVVGLTVEQEGVRFYAAMTPRLEPGQRLRVDPDAGTLAEEQFRVDP